MSICELLESSQMHYSLGRAFEKVANSMQLKVSFPVNRTCLFIIIPFVKELSENWKTSNLFLPSPEQTPQKLLEKQEKNEMFIKKISNNSKSVTTATNDSGISLEHLILTCLYSCTFSPVRQLPANISRAEREERKFKLR